MPNKLPQYTRILHLENNEITSLLPLKNNPHYRHVWDLYIDNNEISSIIVLEGSYWLSHFRTLSLRGNNLRKVSIIFVYNSSLKVKICCCHEQSFAFMPKSKTLLTVTRYVFDTNNNQPTNND